MILAWLAGALVAPWLLLSGVQPGVGRGDSFMAAGHLSIRHRGQITTLEAFAKETMEFITGSSQVYHKDPVETVLSIVAQPVHWQSQHLIAIQARVTPAVLSPGYKTTHVSVEELLASRLPQLVPAIVEKQQKGERLSQTERETLALYERFMALERLMQQELYLVPPPATDAAQEWGSILAPNAYPWEQQVGVKRAWASLVAAVRDGQPEQVEAATRRLAVVLHNLNPHAYPATSWSRSRQGYSLTFGDLGIMLFAVLATALGVLLVAKVAHLKVARRLAAGQVHP